MHSRPLHDASAYLPAKRHPTAAPVPDHHTAAVVSSLTQAQAHAVAAASARIYPYGPTPPNSAAAAAEAVAAANHNNRIHAAMAAAYRHSLAGGAPPPGGPASSIPQPMPQPNAAAAYSQLGHLNHHPSLNSLFINPQAPGSHNGAIVAPPYRELTERYAQELMNAHNSERYKRDMEVLAAQALADNQAAQFYSNRLLPPGLAIAGLPASANQSAVVAAIQQAAASQQQHQNNLSISSSSANQSINSTSTPSTLSMATISSAASSRRRPSLLPHNAPQSAEAFNLALNSTSTSGSTNGSSISYAGASSNARSSLYSDREKYDIYRYSPYDRKSQSSSAGGVASTADRLPSSQAAPYAHLSQPTVVSVNSHHSVMPSGLISTAGGQLLIPQLNTSVSGPTVSFHPATVVISSSSSSPSTSSHHPSVVTTHHPTPQQTPASSSQSSHHQPPPSHQQHHPSSTLSLQHNHLSPGHLLNEIHEAKRPRLLTNDFSGSFAASFAASSGVAGNSASASGSAHSGGHPASGGRPLNQELLIDTRESIDAKKEQAYNPHFEAISPTPNDDQRISPIAMEKQQILDNINVIDREINKVDNHIATLRKKAHELEEVTSKPLIDLEKDKRKIETKEPSITQKIYCENIKLARKAHQKLAIAGPLNELPLYNQLYDLPLAHENFEKFLVFRKPLIEKIRKQNVSRNSHYKSLCETYDKSIREWLKKLEKKEQAPAKKSKDQKLRDYFERQFQELRKQREDKERLQRSGQRVRSEAEMEEVMDGLQVQELEDKKMRSYAVIPPIMYDDVLTQVHKFNNSNGFIDDPMSLYKDTKVINMWTEGEKEIFREKYLSHPKNFGLIATYLERKSVADCVQYYYLSKKTENYKQMLKKHAKKRTRALAKQQQQANAQANRGSPMIKDMERNLKPYPHSATSVILPYAQALPSGSSAIMITIPSIPAPSETKVKASTSTVTTILNKTSTTLTTATSSVNSSTLATSSTTTKPSDSSDSVANNKCGDTNSDNEDNAAGAMCDGGDGTDQDISCCLCGDKVENFAKSRPVSASNLSLYGLTPADYKNGQRVCLKCHLKNVRRQCPIPSCNTPRRKLKRLKALPLQWIEMPLEQKERFAAELDIPLDSKIGCARCVMRISRRIGIVNNSTNSGTLNLNSSSSTTGVNDSPSTNNKGSSKKTAIRKSWTDAEVDQLRTAIKQYGKNWQQIASGFGGTKSANDCKKLFITNKRECNLGTALHEYNESIGKGNKLDTDSDDELSDDSGEETSSVDDVDLRGDRNSDTASASSQVEPIDHLSKTPNIPPPPPTSLQDLKSLSASQGSLKSDYDSSATMSADEGNPPEASSSATSTVTTTTSTTSSITSSIFTSRTSTSSLFSASRHYDLMNSMSTQSSLVPTFLINPNAPSIQNHHHIHLSSSSSSSNSHPHPNSVNFALSSGAPPNPPPSGPPGGSASGAGNKDEPTCVRDLIYKAIEMSLQPESRNGASGTPPGGQPPSDLPPGAAMHHRTTPNSVHTAPTPPPSSGYPMNLKRSNTPNDNRNSAYGKPEGLAIYPSYLSPNNALSAKVMQREEQDEVQDLSKKPTDRKPTPSLQPQIEALRPNSRGSPYSDPNRPLSISSSPGLRSSPSLKGHPQSSTTPTLYQQQIAASLPQPAHSNPSIRIDPYMDPKSLPRGSPFSAANFLPILQQQQQQQQQQQATSLDRNKLKPSGSPMNQLVLQTSQPGMLPSKNPSYVQLSPKSNSANSQSNAQAYRDKLLPPQVGGGGSITQGTPVVIPGQQPLPPGVGKFMSPQSAAALHLNPPNYDAMLRRMGNPGSITAGTPLSVSQAPPVPGMSMPVPVSVSSLAGVPNRKDPMADLKAGILPRGTNMYDSAIIEQFYKLNRNSSPNAQVLANAYHRPFSPNYQSPYGPAPGVPPPPPQPPGIPGKSAPGSTKDQLSNQLLIDFNTSKQMHRRSSSSSEKEHLLPNNAIPDPKHRPSPNAQFHIGSTPPPNSGIYITERGAVIREDGKPMQVPPPGAEHLNAQWNHLAGLGFIPNRQNVIQQWGGGSLPPASTPPNATKASVIQAPKSSSPREHLLVQNAELSKRNSVSPLVTGGTSASALFPPGADAFAALVNAAVQQPSLSVPQASNRLKDNMLKAPSAEGFEKCLIENMQHQQQQQQQAQHSNKQTARIVYPPSQEDLINDLTNRSKAMFHPDDIKLRAKMESAESEAMKRFSPGAFHHLIQPPQMHQLSAAETEKLILLDHRKKMELMAAAAASSGSNISGGSRNGSPAPSQGPLPPSSGSSGSNSERFRSVESLTNSSPSASHSPSLKFAREPFSSEHFERELRQNLGMDFAGKLQENSELGDLKGGVLIRNMPTSEQMDEASKLFSQSFQKDPIPSQDRNSSSSGHLTAANLIDAIITRQINTDSTSSKGGSPPGAPVVNPGGPTSLGNFAHNRFRTGLEGGPPVGPATAPPGIIHQQVQPPPRPSSTSAGPVPPLHLSGMKTDQPLSNSTGNNPLINHDSADDGKSFSRVVSPGVNTTTAPGPAGSLRETIFNVITNNFVTSQSGIVQSPAGIMTTAGVPLDTLKKPSMPILHHHSLIEGIASAAVQQQTTNSAGVDKLRKALQTQATGEKHSLAPDGENSPNKRQATESEIHRQQVIHLAASLGVAKGGPLPPGMESSQHNDTLHLSNTTGSSSGSTTTVTATHWPPVQPTQPAAQPPASTSGQWTSMPTFSIFSQPSTNSAATSASSTTSNTGSSGNTVAGALNDFFQNRIAEAMRVTNTEEATAANSKRPETSKSSDTPSAHKNIAYPDSPSSPGEMVIDENRASSVSPDIKSNDINPLRNVYDNKKFDSTDSRSSASGPGGVIKKLQNSDRELKSNSTNSTEPRPSFNMNSSVTTNCISAPSSTTIGVPQFEPLSDDDDVGGGNEES